jgi:hypothetical protein
MHEPIAAIDAHSTLAPASRTMHQAGHQQSMRCQQILRRIRPPTIGDRPRFFPLNRGLSPITTRAQFANTSRLSNKRNLYKPALQKHYRDKTARNRITRRMICAGTNF